MENGESHRKTCHRYDFPGHAHELTFTCFQGRPFLSKDRTRGYLIDALAAAKQKHAFDLWAYVLMLKHVHLLICPRAESYSIAAILCSIKQPVARRALIYLREHNPAGLAWLATGQTKTPYCLWQAGGGYDRNLTSVEAIVKAAQYLHANPVRRSLVAHAGQWPYSSARAWETGTSTLLPIDLTHSPRSKAAFHDPQRPSPRAPEQAGRNRPGWHGQTGLTVFPVTLRAHDDPKAPSHRPRPGGTASFCFRRNVVTLAKTDAACRRHLDRTDSSAIHGQTSLAVPPAH